MLKKIAVAAALFLAGCTTPPRPVPPTVPPPAAPVEVQIIGINDFHGNLETPSSPPSVRLADGSILKERLGGAAALAATVKRLRQLNSITVSAGDLIGASPLVSAFFLDEPTIQAMNGIGLGLNAVGNHEFDKGSAELLRMQNGGCEKHTTHVPCRVEPFGGASFQFLAANVHRSDSQTILPGSAVRQFGPVKIGFIGMTLKETATLVTPAGVAGLTFADEAETANALVPTLKAQGADSPRRPGEHRVGNATAFATPARTIRRQSFNPQFGAPLAPPVHLARRGCARARKETDQWLTRCSSTPPIRSPTGAPRAGRTRRSDRSPSTSRA